MYQVKEEIEEERYIFVAACWIVGTNGFEMAISSRVLSSLKKRF
jgi:hypothetical protein